MGRQWCYLLCSLLLLHNHYRWPYSWNIHHKCLKLNFCFKDRPSVNHRYSGLYYCWSDCSSDHQRRLEISSLESKQFVTVMRDSPRWSRHWDSVRWSESWDKFLIQSRFRLFQRHHNQSSCSVNLNNWLQLHRGWQWCNSSRFLSYSNCTFNCSFSLLMTNLVG